MSNEVIAEVDGSGAINIILPKTLDILGVDKLFGTLSEAVEVSTEIEIDSAEVERISTPSIQVLVVAADAVDLEGGTFKLKNPSTAVESAFRTLGLTKILASWR